MINYLKTYSFKGLDIVWSPDCRTRYESIDVMFGKEIKLILSIKEIGGNRVNIWGRITKPTSGDPILPVTPISSVDVLERFDITIHSDTTEYNINQLILMSTTYKKKKLNEFLE